MDRLEGEKSQNLANSPALAAIAQAGLMDIFNNPQRSCVKYEKVELH